MFGLKKKNPEMEIFKESQKTAIMDAVVKSNTDDVALRMANRQAAELTKWQQDREPAMRKLFLKLSGYIEEKDGITPSKWNVGYCSIIGARKLVDFVETLDHNVMLSMYCENSLNLALRDGIANTIRSHILWNHKELGIKLHNADYILWEIVNNIEPNYRRGLNNGERKLINEIVKINQVQTSQGDIKKKTLFGVNIG